MIDQSTTKAAKLRALREAFRAQLPDRMETIRRTWIEARTRPEDAAPRKELARLMHNLIGTAGIFGYQHLGESARQIEYSLLQWGQPTYSDAKSVEVIDHLLGLMEILIAREPEIADEEAPALVLRQPAVTLTHGKVLVYVLEDDPLQAQEIVIQLEHFGYAAEAFPTAAAIIQAQERHPAGALLLDVELPDASLEGPRIAPLLQALGTHTVPLVFISARDDWHARLAALRADGRAYFTKPLDFAALVEQLDHLVGHKIQEPFRVLIVEDTVLLAEHYAVVLQDAGMETHIVTNPEQLLDVMSIFGPDIIIMDLHMPQCSGAEAAQIIRQHPAYRGLPIIYLSTESMLHHQLSALSMGGDDFLQKSINDAHLVAAVSIRAERFRELNKWMTCDSLTGLLNHISFKLVLERELALSHRRGGSLSFAMLDIDHFKSVNDRYGHPMGDRVIKSLARLLTHKLRKSDIVGRYGGEEFAVILPDTKPEAARVLIDNLRENFAEIAYVNEAAEFGATFSAGIASMPPHIDMGDIISFADGALYAAKRGGRNRVVVESVGKPTAEGVVDHLL